MDETATARACYGEAVKAAAWILVASGLLVRAGSTIGASNEVRPRDKDVLARAGARVLDYERELPRLVARETSVQRAPRPEQIQEVRERHLVAEFGWVAFPQSSDVVGVRDVVEVDGRAVTTDRDRLQTLLHSGVGTSADARGLLNEAARYNLGPGSRNLNIPTLVLFFLHPKTQARFAWKRRSPPSAELWEFEFKERERPSMIQTSGKSDVEGRVFIEPTTGIVRRSEMHVRFLYVRPGAEVADTVTYDLTTTFGAVETVGLVLPARLEETFEGPDVTITGEASYDNYRRFETDARLLP